MAPDILVASNVEKRSIVTISLLTSDLTEIEHHILQTQGLAESLQQVHRISVFYLINSAASLIIL